jgi:hypothetical protein
MDGVAQPELFGGLFADEESQRRRTVRARLLELTEQHGPMIPQSVMPLYLDVSRARVSQWIQEDRFPVFEVGGKNFIPMVSVEFFRDEERKNGRPILELGFVESLRRHIPPIVERYREAKKKSRQS